MQGATENARRENSAQKTT